MLVCIYIYCSTQYLQHFKRAHVFKICNNIRLQLKKTFLNILSVNVEKDKLKSAIAYNIDKNGENKYPGGLKYGNEN